MVQMIAKKNSKGQTLVEYALIIALISVALIVTLGALQGSIDTTFLTTQAALDKANTAN